MRAIRPAVLIGSCIFTFPAVAGLGGLVNKIDTTWQVQPGDDVGQEVIVRVGDVVTKTRFLPDRVAVLDEAPVTDAGLSVLPAGEQLYSRDLASGGTAFCAVSGRKMTKQGFGEPNSSATDPCFYDSNSDGSFDAGFRIDSYNGTIFGRAIRNKKEFSLQTGRFHSVPREQWTMPTFIGVRYVARPIYSGRPVFAVGLGGEELALTSRSEIAQFLTGSSVPFGVSPKNESGLPVVEILGARLSIINDEKGTLRVRIDRAIQPQPFKFRYNS